MVAEPVCEPNSSVPGPDSHAGLGSKLGRPFPSCWKGERPSQSQGILEVPGWPCHDRLKPWVMWAQGGGPGMASSQLFPALGLARGGPRPAHQLHVGELLGQSVGVTADAEELPMDGGGRLGPVGDGLVGPQQAFRALALGGQLLVQSLQELLHPLSVCLEGRREERSSRPNTHLCVSRQAGT